MTRMTQIVRQMQAREFSTGRRTILLLVLFPFDEKYNFSIAFQLCGA